MNAEPEILETENSTDFWKEVSESESFVKEPSRPNQALETSVPQRPGRQTAAVQLARWRHGGINE